MRVVIQTSGAAAHEINQPLTVIIGKTDMLLDKLPGNDPSRVDLRDIQNAGQRISDIVLKMASIRKFVTKDYVEGMQIVDFDKASEQ